MPPRSAAVPDEPSSLRTRSTGYVRCGARGKLACAVPPPHGAGDRRRPLVVRLCRRAHCGVAPHRALGPLPSDAPRRVGRVPAGERRAGWRRGAAGAARALE
eukprot:4380929-Prymnesium_polylepis.1